MVIYTLMGAFWLPAIAVPAIAPIVVTVAVGLVAVQAINSIRNTSQPFGTAPYANEVQQRKIVDNSYNKFVETENSPKPKVEGEQKTGENAKEAGKGAGVPRGREKVLGFPAPDSKYGGTLNDTQTTGSTALIDTNNPNFYFNREPLAGLIQIRRRRLLNAGFATLAIKDTPQQSEGTGAGAGVGAEAGGSGGGSQTVNLNAPAVDVDRDKWITVDQPTPEVTIGQMQIQPILNETLTLRSAPVTSAGDSVAVFDPTEIVQAVNNSNKSEQYFDMLGKNYLGYESDKNIDELSALFLPYGMISGLNIEGIFGLEALYRIAEGFRNYSFGSQSIPQYRVPTKVTIETIRGIDNSKDVGKINPALQDLIKPYPTQYQDKMANNFLLPSGTELDVELLMRFLGATEIYDGGNEEYKKVQKEFRQNPQSLYNSPFISNIPSIDGILSEEKTEQNLKPKTTNFNTPITSQFDLIQKMIGVSYVKTGLDQFPASLPSLKDPDFVTNSEGKRTYKEANPDMVMPSLAGGLAYGIAGLQKNIGRFPLEVEVDGDQEIPNPNNPSETIPKKDTKYIPDLGTAIGSALTLGLVTANLGQNNFNLNLGNSKQIQETKRIASKGANCACATFDATGMKKNPTSSCSNEPFNFKNASGITDFFKGKNYCHDVTQNVDPVTLKEMLQDILFGVNIIKGAFFKNESDLNDEIASIEQLKQNVDKKKGKLDEFIDDFNNDRSDLSKKYPTKSKITKKSGS